MKKKLLGVRPPVLARLHAAFAPYAVPMIRSRQGYLD